ncbi:MAG: hypothetical protein AAF228_13560 [Pseudomonadota bacterium]
MFAAAAGCAGAVIAKGSCGQGAFQAGLAHLFNAEGVLRKNQVHPMQKSYDDMRANGTFRGSFEQYLDYTSGRVNDASWIYDVVAGVGGVVKSGLSLLTGNTSGTIAKSLGQNPFKGKTADQIDAMFANKGFIKRGPDAKNGIGTYVNPKTNRSYHFDRHHQPPKGPHIGVHRPRGPARDNLPVKDYFLD